MNIGDKVRVKKGFLYSGRVGTIVRQNQYRIMAYGGLWYVDLEAKKRAKQREICIWGQQLEPVN